GAQTIALRVLTGTVGNALYFLHADHLGSTSITTCGNSACGVLGAELSRETYYPYGSPRSGGGLPTDREYTGKYLDDTGLMYYGARYYHPALGRFVSADTMVPDRGPQMLNRYSYSRNNPLGYVDPSGHDDVPFLCTWFGWFCGQSTIIVPLTVQVPVQATTTATATGTPTPPLPLTPTGPWTPTPTPKPSSTPTPQSLTSKPTIGSQVAGFKNTVYGPSRTIDETDISYELKATGKRWQDRAIYANETEFDWYEGKTLVDAKNWRKGGVNDPAKGEFFLEFRAPEILDDAQRQLRAIRGTGFRSIEWRVADADIAKRLQELFRINKIRITVTYYAP
ncbi:MAG: RHS repeat-associated core domain-containing protein, partial [Nitrososphaera sp.]